MADKKVNTAEITLIGDSSKKYIYEVKEVNGDTSTASEQVQMYINSGRTLLRVKESGKSILISTQAIATVRDIFS